MFLACIAGVTQSALIISGEWATPANTFLLIVLAAITIYRERAARKRSEFIAKKVVNVEDQLKPEEPRNGVRTRKDDPVPWQQPSE